MIENQIPNPDLNQPQQDQIPVQSANSFISKIFQSLKNIFNKFYSKKKIFWPVTISIGLILLIILIGLVFGKRNLGNQKSQPLPTPVQTQATPGSTATPNQLTQIQLNLGKIKDQIQSLDVNQSQLTPPMVDYNISFQTQ